MGTTGRVETRPSAPAGAGNLPMADPEEIRLELARAVATRRVADDAVAALAKRLAATKLQIRGIDVCTHGICIDYIFNDDRWAKVLPEIIRLKGSRVHTLTVFPWGIPVPDIFRVRVEQDFDELARVGG
jgi:hypothetical protein